MATDAIIVLAGGIKQDSSGRWLSTDLTVEDNKLGAPGAKLRVFAAVVLGNHHPAAPVITSGGKGADVPKGTPEDRPLIAEILRDELIASGMPANRIILEGNSNTTYQQLQELEKMLAQWGWQKVIAITNRFHLSRLRAMIEAKFPSLVGAMELVSAEDILIGADPSQWESVLAEAYASAFMAERIAREERAVAQIKDGTYQFH
jgi:uncharacterized SAM-binding protein YcdF (DUF218 family)